LISPLHHVESTEWQVILEAQSLLRSKQSKLLSGVFKNQGSACATLAGGGSSFLIILLEFEIQGQFGYSEFGTHKITSRKGSV
jgi:hypothetical protein